MQMYGPTLFYDFRSRDMSTPETLRVSVGVGLEPASGSRKTTWDRTFAC